jgi:hypothetical protein
MALVQRLQRLDNFWFGLEFSLQTRGVYYCLWERRPGELYKLLGGSETASLIRAWKSGSFPWKISDQDLTEFVLSRLPDIKLPKNIVDHEVPIHQTLKTLQWKSIPKITSTLSSLENPLLRTPLCVIKGLFSGGQRPETLFIPCGGKSAVFHDNFRDFAHYDKGVPLIQGRTSAEGDYPYLVDGYIVDNVDLMNEFFMGKKLTIVPSTSLQGVYIPDREVLKAYLRALVATTKISEAIDDNSITITLNNTGKSITI